MNEEALQILRELEVKQGVLIMKVIALDNKLIKMCERFSHLASESRATTQCR